MLAGMSTGVARMLTLPYNYSMFIGPNNDWCKEDRTADICLHVVVNLSCSAVSGQFGLEE